MKNKAKINQEEPVSDGDTRPDHQDRENDEIRKADLVAKKGDKKLSPERSGDTNTLEDFKDAK